MFDRKSSIAGVLTTAFLFVPACIADIVPISINGSVSASGAVEACFGFCNFEPAFDSFSFSGGNTQPVNSISESRQALATHLFGAISEADASAQQSLSMSTLSISTVLELDASGFVEFAGSTSVTADNNEFISFMLTGPALVHLTGHGDVRSSNTSTFHPIELLLTGPGNEGILALSSFDLDETLLFLPGEYDLVATESFEDFSGSGFASSATISFNADFTPVPEPRGMPIMLGALLAVLLTWGARNTRVVTPK